MRTCFSRQDLADLAASRLDSQRALLVRTHMDGCARCRRTYERIAGSALSATLAVEPAEDGREVTRVQTTAPRPRTRSFPEIAGYEVRGVLGHGGMGVVYDAHQIKLNRRVALKVLPAIVGSANPGAVARFRREANAAARLHHTNIIPIYDFGESSDAHYFAMELVIGSPLSELIPKLGEARVSSASATRVNDILSNLLAPVAEPDAKLTGETAPDASRSGGTSTGRSQAYFRQVARWMGDVADALHYAHSQGIIHRDIKPSNLILSADERLMIADFGLARDLGEQSMTVTGAFMGSLRYASPEQAMARRLPVDHRTDVYSLGATMYELLCFQPAFPGDNEKEVLAGVISRDPTPPRKVISVVPAELETICQKAMEKSPETRYATARAFGEDIKRFLHDLPISAKRPGPVRRVVKFVRRHKLAVLAVTAGVVVAGISGLAVRQKRLAIEAERRRAAEETARREAELRSKLDSAISFVELGQWVQAERELREALEYAPTNVDVILHIVWLRIEHLKQRTDLATTAKYEEIRAFCERALALAPGDKRVLNFYSIALKNLGRYQEAIEAARQVAVKEPDVYEAWANLGAYHALVGDLEESVRCLRRAAAIVVDTGRDRPEDRAAVFRNLASVQLVRGERDADLWVSRAIEEERSDVAAWIVRVKMRLSLEPFVDLRTALGDADHADRLASGRHPLAKRMLAMALLRNGEHERAIIEAKRALALNDNAPYDHLIIAIAEAALGNRALAQDHIRAAQRHRAATPEPDAFFATYQSGFLWFDSSAELEALAREASSEARGST